MKTFGFLLIGDDTRKTLRTISGTNTETKFHLDRRISPGFDTVENATASIDAMREDTKKKFLGGQPIDVAAKLIVERETKAAELHSKILDKLASDESLVETFAGLIADDPNSAFSIFVAKHL